MLGIGAVLYRVQIFFFQVAQTYASGITFFFFCFLNFFAWVLSLRHLSSHTSCATAVSMKPFGHSVPVAPTFLPDLLMYCTFLSFFFPFVNNFVSLSHISPQIELRY